MMNRKPWRALWAALLCLALVCGMFAAAAEEEIVIEDAMEAVDALPADDGLELDGDFGDAVDELSDLALNDALELNDALTLDEVLIPAEPETATGAEGGDVILEPSSNDAADAARIPLAVTYFGPTLTKEYDCTNSIFKQTATGTTFAITFPKAENFSLAPEPGYSWVEGHSDVAIKVTSIKANADGSSRLFSGSDVGDDYTLRITFGLEGLDADYYVAQAVNLPAAILPREVVITPRKGLTKIYGADDPAYKSGSWLSKDETSPLHQDISGLPGYAVPVNFTEEGTMKLTITNAGYLLEEAKLKGTKFFPNDGFLSREPGEAVGKYRITLGDVDFGKNFKVTLNEEYFTITRRPITDSDVTVANISDKTYTGKAITPTPAVRYNGKKLKLNTDYKFKYSKNKYPGRATVTVVGLGNFKSNRKVTFKIVLKPTAISKLTADRTQVAVTWNKGSNNSGYQVCYSVNADFTKATTKTVKGIKNTKLTLTGLKAKTTYYVRVRTYKTVSGKNYYSAWSKAKKVTTKQ